MRQRPTLPFALTEKRPNRERLATTREVSHELAKTVVYTAPKIGSVQLVKI